MDFLLSHQTELYILYAVGLILLAIYLYYIFFYNYVKTPIPTSTNYPTPSTTPDMSSEKIKNKFIDQFSKVKNKINLLKESDVISSLKGKLDNWGDDVDRLPTDLRSRAILCYQNPQGCIF